MDAGICLYVFALARKGLLMDLESTLSTIASTIPDNLDLAVSAAASYIPDNWKQAVKHASNYITT